MARTETRLLLGSELPPGRLRRRPAAAPRSFFSPVERRLMAGSGPFGHSTQLSGRSVSQALGPTSLAHLPPSCARQRTRTHHASCPPRPPRPANLLAQIEGIDTLASPSSPSPTFALSRRSSAASHPPHHRSTRQISPLLSSETIPPFPTQVSYLRSKHRTTHRTHGRSTKLFYSFLKTQIHSVLV